ncbi:MAG TPA: hypothetical protein VGX97_02485 [bacterium]|nr:hypothetical protein [bacterium]
MAATIALVAGVVGSTAPEPPQARPASLQAASVRAPDFRLPLLGGGTVSRGSFKGKPAILLFWAPW